MKDIFDYAHFDILYTATSFHALEAFQKIFGFIDFNKALGYKHKFLFSEFLSSSIEMWFLKKLFILIM